MVGFRSDPVPIIPVIDTKCTLSLAIGSHHQPLIGNQGYIYSLHCFVSQLDFPDQLFESRFLLTVTRLFNSLWLLLEAM